MSAETIQLSIQDGIAVVEFCRPRAFNTMNREFWQDMVDRFGEIDQAGAVRVVVVAATGKHFTAGLDLSMFDELGRKLADGEAARVRERFRRAVVEMQ